MMKSFQVSQFATFFMVGVNYQTATAEVREKFSLQQKDIAHLMHDYKSAGGDGIFVLSTCNRTEIYGFGNCPRKIIDLFCIYAGVDHETFFRHQLIKQNKEAIEHLLQVSGGLQSQILGDFEIIGQVKKSFAFAKNLDAHNAFLERLVALAAQTSKRIKNETELSTGASSVAFAAVSTVKREIEKGLFNTNSKVVLLGMGKIGRTTCENLVNQTSLSDITLINRTSSKASELADKLKLKQADYQNLSDELNAADIMLVATGAHEPVVKSDFFTDKKARLILDLSMPRNVEKAVYEDTNFTVVDVDHLTTLTNENQKKRVSEVPKAQAIVNEMVLEFYEWLETRKVAPTLNAMRKKMESWKQKEVNNLLKKHPNIQEEQAAMLADQLLNRITGQFAKQLKKGGDLNGDLRTLHYIFELDN
jgi:glutamyl-tRNA reductase